jgi:fatty acid desaturase
MSSASIKPVLRTRGAPARKRRLVAPRRPILAGAILLAAASTTFLALTHLHPPPPSPVADMRSGSIVILSSNMHDCRHLSFDNITGAIKDQGTGECNDANANAAARLGEVLHHFQDR